MQKRFIIIASFFVLLSCNNSKKTEEKESSEIKAATTQNTNLVSLTSEQIKNAGIDTGKLEMQYISSVLKVSGQVDVPPKNIVTISIPMGGYLANTRILPGMQVSKGQAIAVIQDQQYIQM